VPQPHCGTFDAANYRMRPTPGPQLRREIQQHEDRPFASGNLGASRHASPRPIPVEGRPLEVAQRDCNGESDDPGNTRGRYFPHFQLHAFRSAWGRLCWRQAGSGFNLNSAFGRVLEPSLPAEARALGHAGRPCGRSRGRALAHHRARVIRKKGPGMTDEKDGWPRSDRSWARSCCAATRSAQPSASIRRVLTLCASRTR